MARHTMAEVGAVTGILESDVVYGSPEDAAKAIIEALDEARAAKTTYAAVMQMSFETPWYVGLGYYPGEKSARNAVEAFPGATLAQKIAVVPILSPKGLTLKVAETDEPAEGSKDYELIRQDAALYKLGWDGKTKTRKYFTDLLEPA